MTSNPPATWRACVDGWCRRLGAERFDSSRRPRVACVVLTHALVLVRGRCGSGVQNPWGRPYRAARGFIAATFIPFSCTSSSARAAAHCVGLGNPVVGTAVHRAIHFVPRGFLTRFVPPLSRALSHVMLGRALRALVFGLRAPGSWLNYLSHVSYVALSVRSASDTRSTCESFLPTPPYLIHRFLYRRLCSILESSFVVGNACNGFFAPSPSQRGVDAVSSMSCWDAESRMTKISMSEPACTAWSRELEAMTTLY